MEGIVIHLAVQLWAARFGVIDQNSGLMTHNLIAMPGRTSLWGSDTVARHADICAVLHLTDGGGPGSIELATIRSGCRPGTFTVTRMPAA